jgi:hypothetical protein
VFSTALLFGLVTLAAGFVEIGITFLARGRWKRPTRYSPCLLSLYRMPTQTALDAEGGHTVGDHLFSVGNDLENRETQRLERAALRLVQAQQVLVYLLDGDATEFRPPAARLLDVKLRGW